MAEGNATMEVRARLTADTAQFTKGMSQASSAMNGMIAQTSKFQAGMVGAGIAAAGFATGLIAFGTKAFMAAARVDELDYAMNAVGKSTGLGYDKLNETAMAVRATGIEMEIAQKTTLKFAQNNLDLAYATQLATVAQDLAVIAGENSTETLNRLTTAVITGRSEILKTVGIQKSAGQMYQEYGRTIGKAASALTYQEKQQAVANGAIAEGAKVAGTYAEAMRAPGKLLRSFARLNNELQVAVGGVLVKAFGPLIYSAYHLQKSFIAAIYGSEAFKNVIKAVQMVLVKLTTPLVNIMDKLKAFFDGMLQGSGVVGGLTEKLGRGGKSITELAGKIEFLLPPIAALIAGLSAFAGARIFSQVPILGSLFRGLGGPIGIVLTAFVAMALTSTQVRNAFGNLAIALKPILTGLAQLGKVVASVAAYAVAIFAKALNALASIITKVTTFFRQHQSVLYVVGVIIAALTLGILAYNIQQGLAVVATKAWAAVTKLQAIAMALMTSEVFLIVVALVALVAAFVYAWTHSETFRATMTEVFNNIATTVGEALAWIIGGLGQLLIAFGETIAPATTFGQALTDVINFVYKAYLTGIQNIVKVLMFFINAIAFVSDENTAFGKVVRAVLNFIFKTFAVVVGGILKFIGLFLEALGYLTDTHGFVGKVIGGILDFIWQTFATVVGGVIKYIGMFIEFLGNLLDTNFIVGKAIAGILDFLFDAFALVFGNIFKYIGVFIEFLGNLLDTHNIVGKVIAGILDFLVGVFANAVGGIIKFIGVFISALGNLLDTNNIVGKVIAGIFDFIAQVIFTVVAFIAKTIAGAIGIMIQWVKGNREAIDKIIGLFNNLVEFVGKALSFIPNILATILEKIGSFVKKAGDFIADKLTDLANAARSNKLTAWLADDIDKLAGKFTSFGKTAETTMNALAAPIRKATDKVSDFTSELISEKDVNKLLANAAEIKNALYETAKVATTYKNADMGTALVQSISNGLEKVGGFVTGIGNTILSFTKLSIGEALVQSISDAMTKIGSVSTKIGETILKATDVPLAEAFVQAISDAMTSVGGFAKMAGETILNASDIKLGTALVEMLSNASKIIGGAVGKIGDFVFSLKELEVGDILGDFINNVADFALPKLQEIVDTLEGLKELKIGEWFIENLSEKSITAGKFLVGLAEGIKSFTETDFVSKVGSGITDFLGGLKEGLGFGDVGGDMEKFIKSIFDPTKFDNKAVEDTISSVDRMKAIRSALQQGIDSIKGVLDDLQQAAKDFADSLKDTIIGFAGLKGVELPDGFIPQAKSLIENMRMRLDKSQQFATQIAQLQGYGLDAGALKAIIEEGPIKGSQLAASILGGNAAENIQQINALQKAISFTGAAIGKFGADAAYSDLIANAKNQYMGINQLASTTDAQLVKSQGNNVLIQEGAFKVAINVAGLTGQDQVDAITKAIDAQFQVLAKELAAK